MTDLPIDSPFTQWEELWIKASDAEADSRFFDHNGTHAKYPGWRAIAAAILTTTGKVHSWRQTWKEDKDIEPLPLWPSTLEPIDRVYGGFFGLTGIVAPPGVGKTMLALSSALQAAATGRWNVIYFGAEVDDDEIVTRRNREYLRYPEAIVGNDFFQFRHVGLGQSLQEMVYDLLEIDYTLPVLVVWDSINTITKMMGGDYLNRLSQLLMWAAFARKLSRGSLSFLIVSETNQKGRSKGESLEFWSDLCLNLSGKPDETAVDFKIDKIRRGEWIPIPTMTRHWQSNRFYTTEQLQQLESGRLRGQLPTLPEVTPDDENIDLF